MTQSKSSIKKVTGKKSVHSKVAAVMDNAQEPNCPDVPKKVQMRSDDFSKFDEASMIELRTKYNELVEIDSPYLNDFLGYVRHKRLNGTPTNSEFARIMKFLYTDESEYGFIEEQLFEVPYIWDNM